MKPYLSLACLGTNGTKCGASSPAFLPRLYALEVIMDMSSNVLHLINKIVDVRLAWVIESIEIDFHSSSVNSKFCLIHFLVKNLIENYLICCSFVC